MLPRLRRRVNRTLRELLGRNLREARLKAGLTQKELAAAASTTEAFVSQVENGARNVTLETMERLAGALGAAVPDLLRAAPADLKK